MDSDLSVNGRSDTVSVLFGEKSKIVYYGVGHMLGLNRFNSTMLAQTWCVYTGITVPVHRTKSHRAWCAGSLRRTS